MLLSKYINLKNNGIMETNEKMMNTANEAIQYENKFFPEYAPIDMGMSPKGTAQELEQLVRTCGSNAILY